MIRSRRVAGTLLVLYFLVAAVMVLAPDSDVPTEASDTVWRGLRAMGAPDWVGKTSVEFAMNVLLFVPLSLLGATFRPRWGVGMWLAVGFAVTFAVELLQGVFLPDRTPDVVDMVANTLGAVLGYLLVVLARSR